MEKKLNSRRFNWSIGESILTVLIVIVISLNLWRYLNIDKVNDLYNESVRTTEVLDRYITGAGYKVSPKFILVLRDTKLNKIFDIEATPSTYYASTKSKFLNFNLSKYDMGYRSDNFMSTFSNDQYIVTSIFTILVLSVLSLGPSLEESDPRKWKYILCTNILNVILIILTII